MLVCVKVENIFHSSHDLNQLIFNPDLRPVEISTYLGSRTNQYNAVGYRISYLYATE